MERTISFMNGEGSIGHNTRRFIANERYGEIIEAKKSGKLVLRHNAISGSMKNMQEKVQDSIKVTEEFGEECRNSFKKEYEMAYDEFLREYEKISRIFHMH